MANTPLRAIRVPDALWDNAVAKAKREDTSVTALIVVALQKFVAAPATKRPKV